MLSSLRCEDHGPVSPLEPQPPRPATETEFRPNHTSAQMNTTMAFSVGYGINGSGGSLLALHNNQKRRGYHGIRHSRPNHTNHGSAVLRPFPLAAGLSGHPQHHRRLSNTSWCASP